MDILPAHCSPPDSFCRLRLAAARPDHCLRLLQCNLHLARQENFRAELSAAQASIPWASHWQSVSALISDPSVLGFRFLSRVFPLNVIIDSKKREAWKQHLRWDILPAHCSPLDSFAACALLQCGERISCACCSAVRTLPGNLRAALSAAQASIPWASRWQVH